MLVLTKAVSHAGPRDRTGDAAHSRKRFKQVLVVSAHGVLTGTEACVTVQCQTDK